MKQEEIILEKLGLSRRGALVILSNNELCERILNETPIDIKVFCDKYEISRHRLDTLIEKGFVSIFFNSFNQGAKKFVFEEEALSHLRHLCYDKGNQAKQIQSIVRLILVHSEKNLRETEQVVLRERLQKGKSFEDVSLELGLTRGRVMEIFDRGMRKVLHSLKYRKNLSDLVQQKITLETEINFLKSFRHTKYKTQNKTIKNSEIVKLSTKLVDVDGLSVRALNCLKAAEICTIGDLIHYDKGDMLKFRNFGTKSLRELEEIVENMGFRFGTNLNEYLKKNNG